MPIAAYALSRLMLFGFGWSIAAVLALAADELLPGMKWPIFGVLAALWTLIWALCVAWEARGGDQGVDFRTRLNRSSDRSRSLP